MIWEYLREEEFEEAIRISKSVCAMPVGCLEMHGQHLPVGTDILKASYILKKAAEIEPVCVFPDYKFGNIPGHTTHKGGVRLSPELEMQLMKELCAEIARNGFKKILLVNSHGGNKAFLTYFIRSTQYEKKDYVVLSYNIKLTTPYMLLDLIGKYGREYLFELTDEDIEILRDFVEKKKECGHACFGETALMLGSYLELVRMDRIYALDGLSTNKIKHLDEVGLTESTRFWGVNYPNAYHGHPPEGCNKRIGDCCIRIASEQLARVLRVMKEDDQMLKWNDEWNNKW
ncbi:MAG TPA: creatininase family protein [Clostridiaceae bacterium]|nr:creatininase family protein [Clostridiaceae bacterium]